MPVPSQLWRLISWDRLFGFMVKASPPFPPPPLSIPGAEYARVDSRLRRGKFSGSSHTSDFKIGTPVASLPGAWSYRVSGVTGWSGVSIL